MPLPDQVMRRLRALDQRWVAVGAAAVLGTGLVVAVLLGGGRGGDNAAPVAPPTLPGTVLSTTPSSPTPATSTSTSTTLAAPPSTIDIDDAYEFDVDTNDPGVVARPIPNETESTPPPTTIAPPPWAASTRTTEGGYLGVGVGCARDRSVQALDEFLAKRVGPALGWDYQHVYSLGGDRALWLFQDAFIDHTGVVSNLGDARFVHNAALLQEGACFTLLHHGSTRSPEPFELGDGTGNIRNKWFWPMGGELSGDRLWVYWAEMSKDPYDPAPPDGLGWHPERLWIASYDPITLERIDWLPAIDPGVTPIYGYAVSSDATFTYLFGNTFEQNMVREGGFWNGPHSATDMWLARVPRGQFLAAPEYRTADGWSPNRADAVPIVSRFYAENPMQPRFLDGQWVSATDVDGYWGDALAIDVAPDPWGPWTTVEYLQVPPRGNDPLKNTYHAHLLPWRDGFGSVIVTISNNARDMLRDAWPHPERYRPMVIYRPYQPTPPTTTTTTTTTSTTTSTTTTTVPRTTTTRAPTTTVARTTTVPRTTTTTSSTTTTSTVPGTTAPGTTAPASTVAP